MGGGFGVGLAACPGLCESEPPRPGDLWLLLIHLRLLRIIFNKQAINNGVKSKGINVIVSICRLFL